MTADAVLATTYETHTVDFPIPFPLTEAEIAELRAQKLAELPPPDPEVKVDPAVPPPDPLAGVDLDAIAKERAIARGKHYVEALYACTHCHGENFGGGVMVDDPMMGKLLGRNITTGDGSVTKDYVAKDWDRMVRHGVKPDGTPGVMPSQDFFAMSDRELSDVVTYIQSMPPVDNDVPPPTFGPIGTMLLATGQFRVTASYHPGHDQAHPVDPPTAAPTVEYGEHLSKVCTGCHRANFAGGPIVGGPPDWPPASNITPTGIGDWTYEDFDTLLTTGKRKNGEMVRPPMADLPKLAAHMTEDEKRALFTYLQTLAPADTPAE
jgi:mono/diheme cytochrome c family protein